MGNRFDEVDGLLSKESEQGNHQKILQEVRHALVLQEMVWFALPFLFFHLYLYDGSHSKRPAMYVANHCSWDDIPFVGCTIGWRNYKIVAKKELEKVPILGKAIKVAGNVEVDRTSPRSIFMDMTICPNPQLVFSSVPLCIRR